MVFMCVEFYKKDQLDWVWVFFLGSIQPALQRQVNHSMA